MTKDMLQERIDAVAEGNIGVLSGLTETRRILEDQNVTAFLDLVPERGDALWKRFREFQRGRNLTISFNHFIASVLMPDPLSDHKVRVWEVYGEK